MRAMLLSDLYIALPHVLDDKRVVLLSTGAGRLYHPRLLAQRAAIIALPAFGDGRRPFADAIARVDATHDANGSTIWYYTEAVLRDPNVSEADREAALRIRTAFVPRLSVLGASYATEAAQALEKRALIPEYAADLARFPTPGGSTLATCVEGLVSSGEALGKLLTARAEQRAVAAATATRRQAGQLRTETIGLLTRMRATLADELAGNPALLRERDAELFSFIDELVERREQSQRRRAATADHSDESADESAANDVSEDAAVAS